MAATHLDAKISRQVNGTKRSRITPGRSIVREAMGYKPLNRDNLQATRLLFPPEGMLRASTAAKMWGFHFESLKEQPSPPERVSVDTAYSQRINHRAGIHKPVDGVYSM